MKPELSSSHLCYLTGCFFLSILCASLALLFPELDQYWLVLPFGFAFTLFFAFEIFCEVRWLIEHAEENDYE